ncbi:NAD-P-binding protein [Lindgomyces ingoldianus]|uniref:NAD-P-binding protein n=1 Tax=Lindgomyces ingoldianus TaxID=673940 RepID=A0ACB6QE30_9PLEO|nr:NAD-P-binding protein [Lindgomyces ingoldianus]KAF2465244.1 NAD-P-binding protein [Lindgomyces ingoldianus]
MAPPSLDLGLKDTHVLITGGAGLIGRVVVDHFVAAGSHVSSLDVSYSSPVVNINPLSDAESLPHAPCTTIHCDISSEESVQEAFKTATDAHGPVEVCVALASLDLSVLQHSAFTDASFTQLKRVLDVNVAGTWLTAREWLRGLQRAKQDRKPLGNIGLIIIGSESGHFGERLNAEYSLAKSAVQGGLLMSLRAEAVRVWESARVNCVAPGSVDTARWTIECKDNPEQYWLEAQATTALCKPVPLEAVAKAIVFLASENLSGHIHGQIINVDGGKQGKVMWTKEEVA